MADLVIEKTNISRLLREKYKKIGSGWVSLLKVPLKYHMDINLESLKILEKMGVCGIYINLSKDYDELLKLFKKKKISAENLYFLDAISRMYGEKRETAENCRFFSGPIDTEAISAAIYKKIPEIRGEKKFVFLDSLTTLLLYNHLPKTVSFSKSFTSGLKKLKVDGIMVSAAMGMASEKLINELSNICDEVIDMGGN